MAATRTKRPCKDHGEAGMRQHGRQRVCFPCASARKQAHSRRKLETLSLIKQAIGCVQCGYREHPYALEWDHIDPSEKSHPIVPTMSWERIMDEVEKCQVLCANCHAIKTVTAKRGE